MRLTAFASGAPIKRNCRSFTNAISTQAQDIEGLAAAIHEMSTTAQEVARNAASVATATVSTDKEAQNGYKVLNETIDSTGALAGSIEHAAKVIAELADASNEIGSVLNVIRSFGLDYSCAVHAKSPANPYNSAPSFAPLAISL